MAQFKNSKTETFNFRNLLLLLITFIELVAGIILAYKGLVSSSGQFLRFLIVVGIGLPGVLIFASAIYSLRIKTTVRKISIISINAAYIIIVCVFLILSWHQRHHADKIYDNFYQSIKNDMTINQVRNLAEKKAEHCNPTYDGTDHTICEWRDTYNQDGSKACDCHIIDVTFNADGRVIKSSYSH